MNKVLKALNEVQAEIGTIEKGGYNEHHKYAYVSAADVMRKVQKLFAEKKLLIIPSEHTRNVVGSGEDTLSICYEFTLAHEDGEVWPEKPKLTGMASFRNSKGGVDDKAANKCLTAALKYFIISLFKIPTGDFDDADSQEDRGAPKPPARRQPPAQPTDENSAREETRAVLGKPVTIPVPGTNEGLDYLTWGKQFVASINDAANLAEVHAWIDANVTALGNMEIEAPKAFKHLNSRIAERETALKQAA